MSESIPTNSTRAPAGEMAERVRAFDWSRTPLGPMDRWPRSLRTLVDLLLSQPIPMIMLWGPELTQIYNDGYAVIAAGKHPAALGQANRQCWPEASGLTEPIYRRVLDHGEPVLLDDQLIPLDRHGLGTLEEAFFTVSYSPCRDDAGRVAGIFVTVLETTGKVLAGRERERRQAEEQLRRSRDTFYNLIQNNPFGVFLVDADFRLVQVSLGGRKPFANVQPLLDRDFEEVLRVVWPEPFVSEALRHFRHTLDTGEPYASPATVERRRDIVATEEYDWRIERVTLPDGRFGVVCYFYDLSERQRWEAALREGEGRLRALVNATSDVVYRMSPDWSEMRRLDGRGYITDTAAPKTDWLNEYIHPDDQPRVLAAIREAVRGKKTFELEHRVRRVDGTLGWTHSRAIPLVGPDGEIVEWVGAASDVTARKQAGEALREMADRFERHSRLFEQIASTTPDFIYVFDLQGRFLYANRRLLEVWGRTFEDAVGKDLYELGYPQWHADMHVRELRQVIDTKRPIKGEVPFTGGSGISGVYEYIFTPVLGPGGEVEVIAGTTRDVTERRRAEKELELAKEQAERASAAKSEFLSILSHELRTPLTPVLLTTSLMEAHPGLPDELREDVATIRRNVELESRLISDLLDLTRIEKGKLQLDVQDVDLHAVVRSAIDICQREASARLLVDLPAPRHTVRGDPTRLQQVFWNLVNNAQKFTPPGGTIAVRSSNSGDRVRVEVCDSGDGIDPSVLPRLFTAFEQGDVRAVRQQAGLGLGLAITKRLVEAHGGTVSATSEGRGRGAVFAVELPAVEPAVAPSPAQAPAADGAASPPLKVLLVEDHEPTLRVLEKLLRRLGHRVTGVSNVASASAAAEQDGFDLIISDLGLPDGSGLDVIRQVRERYAGRAIALTGYGMESDVTASREAGFAEHLTKPVDLAALKAAINRVSGRDGLTPAAGAQ